MRGAVPEMRGFFPLSFGDIVTCARTKAAIRYLSSLAPALSILGDRQEPIYLHSHSVRWRSVGKNIRKRQQRWLAGIVLTYDASAKEDDPSRFPRAFQVDL